jgi:hypothetical protein
LNFAIHPNIVIWPDMTATENVGANESEVKGLIGSI